jgi:hypothetical protein
MKIPMQLGTSVLLNTISDYSTGKTVPMARTAQLQASELYHILSTGTATP